MFRVLEEEGYLEVDFPDEPKPRRWLLSGFLEDFRHSIQDRIEEIDKAEMNEDVPTGISGNHVDVSFYPNKAVIKALWYNDEGVNDGENFALIELPLFQTKQLLLDWRKALKAWEEQRN